MQLPSTYLVGGKLASRIAAAREHEGESSRVSGRVVEIL